MTIDDVDAAVGLCCCCFLLLLPPPGIAARGGGGSRLGGISGGAGVGTSPDGEDARIAASTRAVVTTAATYPFPPLSPPFFKGDTDGFRMGTREDAGAETREGSMRDDAAEEEEV